MRHLLFFGFIFCSWIGSFAQIRIRTANIDLPNSAVMFMTTDQYDFGIVKKDSVAYYHFKFKNIGEVPLIIESINSSCLCTTSIFEKEMVDVNDSSNFSLFLNTDEIYGSFDKLIRIIYNGDNSPQIIRIYGKIED
jgi:hypothetical protein